jgi:hypothetical protein
MSIGGLLGAKRKYAPPDAWVQPGHYLCSTRRLYRVEHVVGARALVEDCATGELFDVAVGELLTLRRVERGPRQCQM